jgi:hypothetical protein
MAAVAGCSANAEGYFNVSNRVSRHFGGREDVLQKLQGFQQLDSPVSKVVVIHGLGGQGKSQLVMQYCQ